MKKRILIIGGYGNFGSYIAKRLAGNANIQLVIAGRSQEKAAEFCTTLGAYNVAEPSALDIFDSLEQRLKDLMPDLVIHTSGPFQGQPYTVAKACIAAGCHYVDLADGREFVTGIKEVTEKAKEAGVSIITGASSVPCLSASLLDHYLHHFGKLEDVEYAITTTQHNNRGVGTTAAILSYVGKPFTTVSMGKKRTIFGWQSLKRRHFGELGWRYLANCNIPDLDLFPERYPDLKTIRFYAGLEIPLIHIGLWGLSWFVRAGLIRSLKSWAGFLLKVSFLFDRLGSDKSGFFMRLCGQSHEGKRREITFNLVAKSGHGPNIPCIPAIILAEKLAAGQTLPIGAQPCLGLITIDDYLTALEALDIHWESNESTI